MTYRSNFGTKAIYLTAGEIVREVADHGNVMIVETITGYRAAARLEDLIIVNNFSLNKPLIMSIEIKKAKIKDELFLEAEYSDNELKGHTKKDIVIKSTVPVHQDLKDAFAKLDKHLAILTDGAEAPKSKPALEKMETPLYQARSFSIGGSGDSEGVTISGLLAGTYGSINLNTPFQRYSSSEYKFIANLSADIHNCLQEVEEYLFNGKRAPEQQLELEMDDDLKQDDTPRGKNAAAGEGLNETDASHLSVVPPAQENEAQADQ